MKAKKLFGKMVALLFILVMVVSPASCKNNSMSNEAKAGDTLKLSGQVYISEENSGIGNYEYKKFTGNLVLADGSLGGDGKVKNGQLSYVISVPSGKLDSVEFLQQEYDRMGFSSIQLNTSDAKYASMNLEIINSPDYHSLVRENVTSSFNTDTFAFSGNAEKIMFIYVDKDITITGKGKAFIEIETGIPITTKDFNLSLRKGWNTIYTKTDGRGQINDTGFDNFVLTIEMSSRNLGLKWVLH